MVSRLIAPEKFADEITRRSVAKAKVKARADAASAVKIAYPNSPVGFFRNVLGWEPWSMQRKIAWSVYKNRSTFAKKCHASGGTALAARIALWFLYAFPDESTVVLTTAPTNRQVSELLWREMRDAWHSAKTRLPGRFYDGKNLINVGPRHYALGFSARKAGDVPGFHARRVLVIKDEAAGIDEEISGALESALAGGAMVRKLEISQPLLANGAFYNAFNRDRGLYGKGLFTISYKDTPNFTGEQSIPDLISPAWVEEKRQTWREDSTIYKIRVLAEFPPLGAKQLISPDWCEQARNRPVWQVEDGALVIAVDVAGLGRASTVIYPRAGNYFYTPVEIHQQEPMVVVGEIVKCYNVWHPKVISVDMTGIGLGVYSRLKELELPNVYIAGLNAGSSARNNRDYSNLGSELWVTIAHRLRDGELAGDIDDETTAQLTQALAWVKSDGRTIVDKMGTDEKSPDRADALVYTEHANRALRALGGARVAGDRV